jgi:hypothetical protein
MIAPDVYSQAVRRHGGDKGRGSFAVGPRKIRSILGFSVGICFTCSLVFYATTYDILVYYHHNTGIVVVEYILYHSHDYTEP